MFETLSYVLKYVFTVVIYVFIFAIIRLIYFDIHSIHRRTGIPSGKHPYLKLVNRRDELPFKVDESYILDGRKVLGRSGKCDFAVQDPYLSAHHVEFVNQAGQFYVRDLESKNGTRMNGENLAKEAVLLKNGDRVQVGQMTFIYVE